MPLRGLKLKWAWRAQFLSHTLQILEKLIIFEDLQMILLSFLETLLQKFEKIYPGVEKSLS